MKHDIPDNIQRIATICQQHGGSVWVVGGTVRDMYLQRPSKDWDLEVHQIDGTTLYNILQSIGPCKRVGKSFSVFKLNWKNMEIDVAVPQEDDQDNPHMGITEALRRRDLTINAMAYNLHNHTVFDPFQGQEDIHNTILRATDPQTFVRDPLRALRVAQFSARFCFEISPDLISLCQNLDLSHIPKERILIEMHKMWLRSPQPSIGLKNMKRLKLFSIFPLWENPTDPSVLDALDRCVHASFSTKVHHLAAFWICALHKTSQTHHHKILNTLKLHSINRINLQDLILPMLQALESEISIWTDTDIRRLSDHIPMSFAWTVLTCIYPPQTHHHHIEALKDRIDKLHLWNNPLPQLLKGKDLMRLGYIGKEIGSAMKFIREQQICGVIHTSAEAIQLLQNRKQS